jgi:hypothetical protein
MQVGFKFPYNREERSLYLVLQTIISPLSLLSGVASYPRREAISSKYACPCFDHAD